jgi:uncharacterized protein
LLTGLVPGPGPDLPGQGTLVIMPVGDGSSLAALATANADLDQVAYEMTLLAEAAGGVLTPGAR